MVGQGADGGTVNENTTLEGFQQMLDDVQRSHLVMRAEQYRASIWKTLTIVAFVVNVVLIPLAIVARMQYLDEVRARAVEVEARRTELLTER